MQTLDLDSARSGVRKEAMDVHWPKDASLYIFDFCGTLFRSNTTKDYLAFLKRTSSMKYKLKYYTYWLVAKLLKDLKLIGPNEYMKIRVKTLQGLPKGHLVEQAKEFLNEFLSKRANVDVLTSLLRLNEMGKGPIILSNTLNLILKPFAEKYNIDRFYGSKVEFDIYGCCTGAYRILLASEGKLEYLRKHYPDKVIRRSWFITDDLVADRDLFEYVEYAQDANGI